jgi:hypothetical protein
MNYFAFTANHAKQERDDLLERMHQTNEALSGPSTLVACTIPGPRGERIPCGSESRPMTVADVFEAGVLEVSCYFTGEVLKKYPAGTWVECVYDNGRGGVSRILPGEPSETRGVL